MDWPTEIGTTCFLQSGGKTLFYYRDRGERDIHKGYYVSPGGHLERGERGVDCVIREFREETGLTIKNPRLRQIVMFYNKDRILGGKTDRPDWYVEVYHAVDFEGELKKEREGEKLVWIDNSTLKNLKMYECDKRILRLLGKKGLYQVLVKHNGEKLEEFDAAEVSINH